MLAAIRSFARSWIMKVLLALLVVSFAIWGIGDVFTGGAGNVVARVGDLEVTAQELDDSFRRTLQQLQQQSSEPVTRSDAIRFGLLEQTLQSLVAQRLLDAEAKAIGMTTSDEAVARLISEEPAFQVDGRFDRERFQLLLRQNGLDENAFAEQLRAERTRDALAGSIRAIGPPPAALVDRLADRFAESRKGELLVVPRARFADVAPPDDAPLEAFLAERQARFQAAERRDIAAVLLSPELLVDEIAVDEQVLRERYDARRDAYTTPEVRTVRQLRGGEEAAVREAHARLQAGETPAAVVDAVAGVALSALGPVEEAALPEAFAAPIFAASGAGAIMPPVESAFGWHIFVVDEVSAARVRPFEAVRDELRAQAARELAVDQLPDLATALDDAIGGGATLEQAADDLALPFERASGLDRAGRTADGDAFAPFAAWGELLTEAFDAAEGEVSLLEQTDDGRFFVYRVDRIEQARPLTLDEARDEVVAAWRAEEAARLAREAAAAALADLEAGRSLEEVAGDHDLVRRTIPAQTRTDRTDRPAVQAALFATEPGGVANEPVDIGDGAALVVVDAEVGRDDQVAAATAEQVAAGFSRDLLTQFEQALRRARAISVDRRALERFFPMDPTS